MCAYAARPLVSHPFVQSRAMWSGETPGWVHLTIELRSDVRFFPLAARGGERYDLDGEVRDAIAQMTNLKSLVWTVRIALMALMAARQVFESRLDAGRYFSTQATVIRGVWAFIPVLRPKDARRHACSAGSEGNDAGCVTQGCASTSHSQTGFTAGRRLARAGHYTSRTFRTGRN